MDARKLFARQEERFIPNERQLPRAAAETAALIYIAGERNRQNPFVPVSRLALIIRTPPEILFDPLALHAADDGEESLSDCDVVVDSNIRDDIPVQEHMRQVLFLVDEDVDPASLHRRDFSHAQHGVAGCGRHRHRFGSAVGTLSAMTALKRAKSMCSPFAGATTGTLL